MISEKACSTNAVIFTKQKAKSFLFCKNDSNPILKPYLQMVSHHCQNITKQLKKIFLLTPFFVVSYFHVSEKFDKRKQIKLNLLLTALVRDNV